MILDRKFVYLAAFIFAVAWLFLISKTRSPVGYDAAVCEGPPLRSIEARNDAMENGYAINARYDCIDKQSFVQVAAERAARERSLAEAKGRKSSVSAPQPELTLAQARQGFQTGISVAAETALPLPRPPARLFVRSDYSRASKVLPAFITPDPADGRKHAAIIWLTGGDTNSLDDFWTPGSPSDDQSASAFREAGIIMMFPTLRGGNGNAGGKEFFLGEVDDVLAAAEHLAGQVYVDAERIYLGGHSTGGTLALLTAETSGRFKAVFAFGPVAQVDRYPPSVMSVNFRNYDERETSLRSPIHWLGGIVTATYVIEGRESPSNIAELDDICAKSRNPLLRCIAANGVNHFSVLSKVSRMIAARLAVSTDGVDFSLRPEEF